MYETFMHRLEMYANAIRILSKGYLPILLLLLSKIQMLNEVRKEIWDTNQDYGGIKTKENVLQHPRTFKKSYWDSLSVAPSRLGMPVIRKVNEKV